jgi:nucleoside-diphosphate-sugar epimerase
VTRDYVHTSDVTRAFILASANINDKIKGEAFNIGTGKKTSIKELMELIKEMYKIKTNPKFGKMENRVWDHGKDWFADTQKAAKVLNFKAKIGLKEGLRKTSDFNKTLNEN